MKDHSRTDGLIADYCDGSFVKNHPYFQRNPNALQLVMYFDEVEICDALASHKGQHKLGKSSKHIPHSLLYHLLHLCMQVCFTTLLLTFDLN